jgi:hypothetical protein
MIPELLAQNAVLFAKVINDMQLPLVHPARYGQQNETERIEYFGNYVSSISTSFVFWAIATHKESSCDIALLTFGSGFSGRAPGTTTAYKLAGTPMNFRISLVSPIVQIAHGIGDDIGRYADLPKPCWLVG